MRRGIAGGALALPLTTAAGGPFPERGLIVFLAFAVILFTLVVPGPVPASPDRPPPDQHGGTDADEKLHAGLVATKAALAQIDTLAGDRAARRRVSVHRLDLRGVRRGESPAA